jgi:hypothetical protein
MPENKIIRKSNSDDALLTFWYISLALGITALSISLYSLYKYHQKKGE